MYAQFNPKHSVIAKRILSKSKPNRDYIPKFNIYWTNKTGGKFISGIRDAKLLKQCLFQKKNIVAIFSAALKKRLRLLISAIIQNIMPLNAVC